MYRYCAGPAYYRICAQRTFTVQNKPGEVTQGNHRHQCFVSGIGQKKTVDAAKICGGAENVIKTETQQTFVNGLLGFVTLNVILLRWKRVCIAHNNCMVPIDMGNSICTAH